jgi:hypothetical protein
MKLDELVAGHVAGTTLEAASVKIFLKTPPQYYQWGINHALDESTLHKLIATDLFAFYFRYYLTGRHKTLQAVLREVRAFSERCQLGASFDLSLLGSYSQGFTQPGMV